MGKSKWNPNYLLNFSDAAVEAEVEAPMEFLDLSQADLRDLLTIQAGSPARIQLMALGARILDSAVE